VGNSITKRRLADAMDAAETAWNEFVNVCRMGGVTVPTLDSGVAYWDMSGISWSSF